MKKVLLIATGGTIASRQSQNGLAPALDADSLLRYLNKPNYDSRFNNNERCNSGCDTAKLPNCTIEGVSIMDVDSTNMSPELMGIIAQTVCDNYNSYDGFVVTHGTDTMAYSATAVSYMLKGLYKPVVFTGSQIPMEQPGSDAYANLRDSIEFACESRAGVYVVFNGKVIKGTCACKVKTRSMDAFVSVNEPDIACINNGVVMYDRNNSDSADNSASCENADEDNSVNVSISEISADTRLCSNITVVKLFPGIDEKIFDYIKDNYKGVIVECFGVGGAPDGYSNIAGKLIELAHSGIAVVITTQCLYEGIDINIYQVGESLSDDRIILGGKMTTEALTMKLMWALAHFEGLKEIKAYMEQF